MKAVAHITYDLISPIYDFMIQMSGLENGSADGLGLLTSSQRMPAGSTHTGEAAALCWRSQQLSRELSKVTHAVSHSCDLSETQVHFLP